VLFRITRTPPVQVRRSTRLASACALLGAAGTVTAVVALRQLGAAASRYLNVVDPTDRVRALSTIGTIRSGLVTNLVLATVTVLVLGTLSLALHLPARLVRVGAWIAVPVLSFSLIIALAGGPESPSPGDQPSAADAARAALLSLWYPALTSVFGAIQLASMIAIAVLLGHPNSADFYHGRRPTDPRFT
jgi:hypothetical protein